MKALFTISLFAAFGIAAFTSPFVFIIGVLVLLIYTLLRFFQKTPGSAKPKQVLLHGQRNTWSMHGFYANQRSVSILHRLFGRGNSIIFA